MIARPIGVPPEPREVRVRVVILTFHAACAACGASDWIDPRDCDAIARFAQIHLLPTIDYLDALVDDAYRLVPVELTR